MRNHSYGRTPDNRRIIQDGYAQTLKGIAGLPSKRDHIIASIMEQDEIQKEIVKRLIIEDSRLDILMRLLGFLTLPHHMVYIKFFENLRKRGLKSGMILGPRGSGKSTANDICYAVMRALQNPNINILIASRTEDQAKTFLSGIKECLMKPQIQEIFGDLKGDVWEKKSASVKDRGIIKEGDVPHKEQTFHVAGADGSVVSKHFDIIIADDLVEEKNSKTEANRDQVMKFYYKSLIPCLRSGGEVWVLGTRYHPEDLYDRFIRLDPKFKDSHMVLPGVFDINTGETVDLEENGDGTFSLPKNATVWDPVMFSVKEVLNRRQGMSQGDFEAQYQNRIEFLKGDYFDANDFQYYPENPEELVKEKDLSVWTGVDLAISEKQSADEFAICTVGILAKPFEVYVLEYLSGRFSFNKQKQIILDMYDRWDPVHTFIESNAYQKALEGNIREEFPDVRTVPIYTTQDKITRATAFALYYERHQVYHRKNRSAKLDKQLAGFPNLKLKDLFDALYIAVSGATRRGRRRKRTKKIGVIRRK